MASPLPPDKNYPAGYQSQDEALWKQFKQGDKQALKEIYIKYLEELFNYGCKVVPHRNLVKDCIHDLFVDIWRSRQRLSDTDHIKYYLIKALRRKLIRSYQKTKKFERGIENHYNLTSGKIIEQEIIEVETIDNQRLRLQNALSTLPNRQKEVINLLIYEEFSYDMVANIMGINLKSVYNLACKAISSLRKELMVMIWCGTLCFFYI